MIVILLLLTTSATGKYFQSLFAIFVILQYLNKTFLVLKHLSFEVDPLDSVLQCSALQVSGTALEGAVLWHSS